MMELKIFTVFLASIAIINSQKSFLMTTSVGYYNYRQLSNVLEVYHLLRKLGYEDHHMLLSFPQNIGCCQKNVLQGSVSFREGDFYNLNRQVEADYKYDTMTVQNMANVISMKYSPQTLNLKRLKLDDQPYFLYLTGHGGDYYFKLRERMAFVDQNFQHMFKDLSKRRSTMPIFNLIDSCSAITPYQQIEEQNFIALGSSSLGEKSLSKGYEQILNCPKSDEFTFYLSQYLISNNPLKTNVTIKKLQEFMDFTKLKVHSKLISKAKKNRGKLLRQFMARILKFEKKEPILDVPPSFIQAMMGND